MSEQDEKPAEEPAPKKSRSGVLGVLLPAVFAGAAAFGGARMAAATSHGQGPHVAPPAEAKPPGPTVSLEPFLVTVIDATKKSHPMKVTLAIEFAMAVKEDTLKSFTPRIRDAVLSHLRTVVYEDVIDSSKSDKLRVELLERLGVAGVSGAERVLVTDLVVQ